MTKDQIISSKIIAAMATGLDLPAAWDVVFGLGAYKKMAGDLYSALRAKQGLAA